MATQATISRPAGRVARSVPAARHLLIEVAVVAAVFLAYRQIRLLTADQLLAAHDNAVRVIDLERSLHIFSEGAVQDLVSRSHTLVLFLNRYYVTVHFPATTLFLVWLYVRHRAHYRRIRRWFVAVTAVALAVHIAFPLAPPRLVPGIDLVDTLQRFGPQIYSADTTASAANQLAAMPSLHVGWAFMVAASFVMVKRTRASLWLLAHPAITLLAVVATANHYWLDAACAVVLAALVWLAAGSLLGRPENRDGEGGAEGRADADVRACVGADVGAASGQDPRSEPSRAGRPARSPS